jgi:hypothetical protein
MQPRVPEFLPFIVAGLSSPELDVQFETMEIVSITVSSMGPEAGLEWIPRFLQILHECAIRTTDLPVDDYNGQLVNWSAGRAVGQMALVVAQSSSADLLTPTLADIVQLAQREVFVCKGCAAGALFTLSDLIADIGTDRDDITNLCDQIVNIMINSISIAESDDVSSMEAIQSCLANLIKKCGVEILSGRHMDLLTQLSGLLVVLSEQAMGENISKNLY